MTGAVTFAAAVAVLLLLGREGVRAFAWLIGGASRALFG